jgi:hypothetical protein
MTESQRITDDQLDAMILRLRALNPTFHAPADGLGKYLGDGMPYSGPSLRSNLLLEALEELKQRRDKDALDSAD